MSLELYAVAFKHGGEWYHKAIRVLKKSTEVNSPNTPFVADIREELDEDLLKRQLNNHRHVTYYHNARKMRWQNEVVQAADEGQLIGFLDCDSLVLNDLTPIIEQMEDYDLGITVRGESRNIYALNTGVVFVRVSNLMKDFYKNWAETCAEFMESAKLHNAYRSQFGGVSQSSLGHLLGCDDCGLRVNRLTTKEWNALNADHADAIENSRIVHLMGSVRNNIRTPRVIKNPTGAMRVVQLWKDLYADVTSNNSIT